MASFNKVVVMGNLTRNVELRHTPRGTAVCELGLAVNRSWFDKKSNKRKEEATFIDITMWGRQAEVAAEYLRKAAEFSLRGGLNSSSGPTRSRARSDQSSRSSART